MLWCCLPHTLKEFLISPRCHELITKKQKDLLASACIVFNWSYIYSDFPFYWCIWSRLRVGGGGNGPWLYKAELKLLWLWRKTIFPPLHCWSHSFVCIRAVRNNGTAAASSAKLQATGDMGLIKFISAIITRALFILIALIGVWRVTRVKEHDFYWLLTFLFLPLVLEMIITLRRRKGKDYKWWDVKHECKSVEMCCKAVIILSFSMHYVT